MKHEMRNVSKELTKNLLLSHFHPLHRRFQSIWEFGSGHILAPSVPEEVIDTDTKPSKPVDWTEHLFRACRSVCV